VPERDLPRVSVLSTGAHRRLAKGNGTTVGTSRTASCPAAAPHSSNRSACHTRLNPRPQLFAHPDQRNLSCTQTRKYGSETRRRLRTRALVAASGPVLHLCQIQNRIHGKAGRPLRNLLLNNLRAPERSASSCQPVLQRHNLLRLHSPQQDARVRNLLSK
jgi:hypothetical protein